VNTTSLQPLGGTTAIPENIRLQDGVDIKHKPRISITLQSKP